MKGVSAVIATILLLLVVIAIVGFFQRWYEVVTSQQEIYVSPPEMPMQGEIKIVPLNESENYTVFMTQGDEACVLQCRGSCGYNDNDMRNSCAIYFGNKMQRGG